MSNAEISALAMLKLYEQATACTRHRYHAREDIKSLTYLLDSTMCSVLWQSVICVAKAQRANMIRVAYTIKSFQKSRRSPRSIVSARTTLGDTLHLLGAMINKVLKRAKLSVHIVLPIEASWGEQKKQLKQKQSDVAMSYRIIVHEEYGNPAERLREALYREKLVRATAKSVSCSSIQNV